MNYMELDEYLLKKTMIEEFLQSNEISESELRQLMLSPDLYDKQLALFNLSDDSNQFVHTSNYTEEDGILRLNISGDEFLISKHGRFFNMLKHKHSWFELNYIYRGTCTQTIHGRKFDFQEGDLIILDKNVEHSIEALGEEDILINFLAPNEFFGHSFIRNILGDNIVGNMMASIITNGTKEKNFLLFHTADNWMIRQTIQNILCEEFSNKQSRIEIIRAYLTILFSRLLESETYELFIKEKQNNKSIPFVQIIQYIHDNYLDISLEQIALQFNYSPEHLGRVIKKMTGKTFSNLIQEQKFKHASTLLQLTDRNIEEISKEIGYNNLTFFYKKFQSLYGLTPKKYRNKFKK